MGNAEPTIDPDFEEFFFRCTTDLDGKPKRLIGLRQAVKHAVDKYRTLHFPHLDIEQGCAAIFDGVFLITGKRKRERQGGRETYRGPYEVLMHSWQANRGDYELAVAVYFFFWKAVKERTYFENIECELEPKNGELDALSIESWSLQRTEDERVINSNNYSLEFRFDGGDTEYVSSTAEIYLEVFLEAIDDDRFHWGFRRADIETDLHTRHGNGRFVYNEKYETPVEIEGAELTKFGTKHTGFWRLESSELPLNGVYKSPSHVFSVVQEPLCFSATLSVSPGRASVCYFDGSTLDSENREYVLAKLLAARNAESHEVGKVTLQRSTFEIRK